MSIIELKNVSKTFKTKSKEIIALDDISLTIEKGEIFGLIGYSGAGKSTLLRLFNGLEKPTTGNIKVLNKDVINLKAKNSRDFRQKIGMIFQHFNLLWSKTVIENIELPLKFAGVPKNKRHQRAKELAILVGLENHEQNYPSELSGGQKQRVGIARALASNPEILLSDESTSALDPQTTDEILDLLLELNHKLNLTVVLITHEMHVIRRIAKKVAIMEKGRIIESSTVVDLFNKPQTKTAKRFIHQDIELDEEKNKEILKNVTLNNPQVTIVELLFKGNTGNKAIITQVVRKFSVEINILQGKLKQTNGGILGTLLIALSGEEIEAAIAFLQQLNIGVEVRNFV